MKKFLAILMSVLLVVGVACLVGCGNKEESTTAPADSTSAADTSATDTTVADTSAADTTANADDTTAPVNTDVDYSKVKFGLICLHDENSTYDNNFITAIESVKEELGLSDDQVVIKKNIAEDDNCYNAAADLVDAGCNVIFADSFGHETYMIQAAKEFTDVQFCHATGTQSNQVKLPNYHNAFASIYEGRYLAGVAAGLKIQEMIEAGKATEDNLLIGYVGAFDYAEVKSGYTSFYLGVKSICPTVKMEVKYTNSWFDIAKEKEAALALINDGCVLISQHADSEGAPKACEEKGIPNVAYNIDTSSIGPNTAIVSSKINWAPYFKLVIDSVSKGETFATDWCGTIASGSVELTKINEAVAAKGTQEKLDEVKAQLEAGTIKVFDTKNWQLKGETLTEYKADVDGDYTGETNVIIDGIFVESGEQFRSAPYFDIIIDGIVEK